MIKTTLALLAISTFSLTAYAATPQRIIALSPHAVEMLYAIGAGDKIIATTEYADYPEDALSIPRIGGYHGIQLDRVIELKPDLIVVWQGGNQPGDIEQLKRMGYPIYHSEPSKLEEVANEMEQLGEMLGYQEQAHAAATAYRQRMLGLRRAYKNQPPIKVFYQLWGTPLMSVSKQSWIHQMIDHCGGVNVMAEAKTAYPQVSLEQVLLSEAQVIVHPDDHGSNSATDFDWQAWQELPAVKHQQIYGIDGDLLHRFSPRALDGMHRLCESLMTARSLYAEQGNNR
ncbi:cobalamin-binding protein [Corallincola luteus]|uniref:Cobalamin-binding protein n=1 Tax=Corallincola luteus TaxID=1775177 RepID=A0ABY2ARY1_9GAMM|nr:cobalamin-binding protein [Corallincola luteus]TCI04941.1 cobalamin-binding protein [Corallincola luteus]